MDWLRRIPSPTAAPAAAAARPDPIDGSAPGITALLEGVSQDRSHAVLDLGPASDRSLRVYSRFARWIQFADLLGEAWPEGTGVPAGPLLPRAARSYDLVFAWDILDRLVPDDRPLLVEWLIDITSPDARVHVVVRGSDDALMRPLRFTLLDTGLIRYEPIGTARLTPSRLLPAEVARVLAPLHIVHAFTLKTGLREYVALRR